MTTMGPLRCVMSLWVDGSRVYMISWKGECRVSSVHSVCSLRFKLNIEILYAVKRLYLTKFKETYTHKEWKNKEMMEEVNK